MATMRQAKMMCKQFFFDREDNDNIQLISIIQPLKLVLYSNTGRCASANTLHGEFSVVATVKKIPPTE